MSNSVYADKFAELLNEKFKDHDEFASNVFTVMSGRKFDRIVQANKAGEHRSVHAFVERETGHVYKASGWPAPAKGVRFFTVEEAAFAATLHGAYLYA